MAKLLKELKLKYCRRQSDRRNSDKIGGMKSKHLLSKLNISLVPLKRNLFHGNGGKTLDCVANLRVGAVCRRLDRFLFSACWENLFPSIRHKALPRIFSDHCPIELDTSTLKWGPKPFRFENSWLEHPDFKRILKDWWKEDQLYGWEGYKFIRRLKLLKTKMKLWSKEVIGDMETAKREAEARLAAIDMQEGRDGLDSELRKEREDLQLLVGDIIYKEEVKWRRRGKVKWARDGDENTKFFHMMAIGYRKRNYIEWLEMEDGVIIENENEIESEAINFFKNLYSSNDEVGWGVEGLNWCPISSEKAAWIERPFEEVEVRNAVFDCGKDKSPGADGFTLFFFQYCWDIVKGDLMKVMEDFYNSEIINAVTNEILICLIPKNNDSAKLRDFRPISLVTSAYKVVSKVLATRLGKVLDDTISATQGAFVKNRQILDAVLVANEVVQEAMKLNKLGLVFKIDFDHAYDHVEWKLVDEVMDKKGFGGRC
ncbi:hypothetical protein CerSpe_161820 [Prunus speciosa]